MSNSAPRNEGQRSEALLAEFFSRYVDAGRPGLARYAATSPLDVLRAFAALRSVQWRDLDGVEGEERSAVVGYLRRDGRTGPAGFHRLTAVLDVPAAPGDYALGSAKQTLRRKERQASRAGVTWRQVTDLAERRALLERADTFERGAARGEYRSDAPDNDEVLGFALWLVAEDASGRPLLLSVTPVAGEWAVLRYFRVLSDAPEASETRYLMTRVLVDELAARGVRHLADGVHPVQLSNGLRHFQRMTGFDLVRVRVPAQ